MTIFNKTDLQSVWGAMKPDVFTTRIFFDPLAIPLTILFSKARWISANGVTFSALVPGLIGACLFATGNFIGGAIAYYIFFLLDSIDGKLARLRGAGDPLGAFYDFVVDRIVIGLMLLGMGWSFIHEGMMMEFVTAQLFLFIFFIKDVFDLKWKESGVIESLAKRERSVGGGFFARYKIHFKPGQLLSCFIIFIVGPLSQAYVLSFCLAIACVLFSLAYNVLLPWASYLQTRR